MVADPTTRRPVVVVAIKGLGIGGAEKLVSEAARFWDRSTFDYRVAYALPWKDQLVGELEAQHVPVRCVGTRKGITVGIVSRFRQLLAEWDADLIHAHLPVAGIVARLAGSAPVLYTEHNLAWSYRPLTRALNRFTYRRNVAVTAVSEAVANSLHRYPGPTPEVVNNGVTVAVDPSAASQARSELGLSETDLLAVHVGNIRPGKGHDLLIDTSVILRDRGLDITVVSIGGEKNPGDLQRLQAKASAAGLDGRLRFLGRRPDALSFVAAADVYLNPADIEGLPVTILEAMALGRPVVATAVGGVPQVVHDQLNGLTVAPRRPDLLADAVAALVERPDEARRMGAAAYRLVAAEYGLEPMVRRFEDIYHRVLL